MTTPPRSHKGNVPDESPLRRWSRRKQAAREGGSAAPEDAHSAPAGEPPDPPADAPPEANAAAGAPAAHDADAEAAADDADSPTDADMPPIESLDGDSDYSQFMSPGVSDSLRRMALRKLFGMSGFNIRDGLDDYDEDFTRYQSLGDTVTSDMKYHAERRARLAEEERARTAAANDDEAPAESRSDTDPGAASQADAGEAEARGDDLDPQTRGHDDDEDAPHELG